MADIALALPFAFDAAGNVLGWFAVSGFDVVPHALGWTFVAIAFGLAVAPSTGRRPVAFGLVAGFGAAIDLLWEITEYLLMKSGASGLRLTYDNTIQDLATSFLGGVVGALAVATVLWPAAGTSESLFRWALSEAPSRQDGSALGRPASGA